MPEPRLPHATMPLPELLAPAGDAACLRAAIENGADAVYFGLNTGFNARARAANFSLADLPAIMADLHRRGMKGYVTLNTLVLPGELAAFEETVRTVALGGADAVMIQDLGAARLAREVCPELPVFASTQMSLSSAEGIAAAAALGIRRVVLARELSLEEIAQIRRQTTMSLEVFVHGALCISYSGQCLASLALGGRSANRGQCAQACRMPYSLICDDEELDLGDRRYPLSPKDLAAFALLPRLIAAGVDSLKIEGRLKSAEYVAAVTRCYRRALDAIAAGGPPETASQEIADMEMSFSRGFSHGWLEGLDPKVLVPGQSSANRGILLGAVERVFSNSVQVRLAAPVQRGDGVVFAGDRTAGDEQGGRIYEVFLNGRSIAEPVAEGVVELAFAHDSIDWGKISPQQEIWKTDDPRLTRRLQAKDGERFARRLVIDLKVEAHVGRPIKIEVVTETGLRLAIESAEPLAEARKHPLSVEVLREQFGRLGGTTYALLALAADIVGGPMAPLSVLGKLRHDLVAGLDEALSQPPVRQVAPGPVLAGLRQDIARDDSTTPAVPKLSVLCRTQRQLEAAMAACGVDCIIADFRQPGAGRVAVQAVRSTGKAVFLTTPRMQMPGDEAALQRLAELDADGILARSLAGLAWFAARQTKVVADTSLNAINELAVDWLLRQGAARLTVANDLDREEFRQLLDAVDPLGVEVVVHQHMPLMHSRRCVFCWALSEGKNRSDCGRPCERHALRLRDRMGVAHYAAADSTCGNTLFSGAPQTAIEQIPAMLARGVRHFRIELPPADDTGDPRAIFEIYLEVLAGHTTGLAARKQLQEACTIGLARSPIAF